MAVTISELKNWFAENEIEYKEKDLTEIKDTKIDVELLVKRFNINKDQANSLHIFLSNGKSIKQVTEWSNSDVKS